MTNQKPKLCADILPISCSDDYMTVACYLVVFVDFLSGRNSA